MLDWITIHQTLSTKMRDAGLKYGAAMSHWIDDYYGEEVKATHKGVRQGVMKHIMPLLDEYIVMSHNTSPTNAANRLLDATNTFFIGELHYANTLPLATRPRIRAALETHAGVGATVSYGDHATKNSRAAVLADIEIIKGILGGHASFGVIDIHDWVGWRDLR
jgi:hypothetical protein